MRNNLSHEPDPLMATNVIYEYKCITGDCELQLDSKYIGMTTTTLSRRMTMHLASGGPKSHSQQQHHQTLSRQDLVANTKIIGRSDDFTRLQVLEAVHIKTKQPTINNQSTGASRILRLLGDSSTSRQQNYNPQHPSQPELS